MELRTQLRGALQRGGSGVAVASVATAATVVLALALALRLGAQRFGDAQGEWAVGIEDATLEQVAWALLGVALCSYHLVRKQPQPTAPTPRPRDAPKRWSALSMAATVLSDAASDLLEDAWTRLPSFPALPALDWVLPTLSSSSSERSGGASDASGSDEEDADSKPPLLTLADELSPPEHRAPVAPVNSERPIPFENDLFKGSLLVLVNDPHARSRRWRPLFGDTKRTLSVQVQGQFKRAPPPGAVVYLAWELPVRSVDAYLGFWAHKLAQMLVAVARQLNPDAHVSLGEGETGQLEGLEVPHAAFPLYQHVDELVISPAAFHDELPASRLPALGQETFGESETHAKSRAALPVGQEPRALWSASKVVTFQFHSEVCDLAQWRLVNLPGLPDVPLQRLCADSPLRLSAYALAVDTSRKEPQRHVDRAKEYLFCFSVRHRGSLRSVPSRAPPRFASQVSPIAIPSPPRTRANSSGSSSGSSDDGRSTTGILSPRSAISSVGSSSGLLSPAFANHVRSEPLLRRALLLASETPLSPTIRQFAAASHALSALQFELSAWVERVDPVAGRRSVAYVFTVDDSCRASSSSPSSSFPSPRSSKRGRRTVVRSASTVKNVLLKLLDRDDDDDRDGVDRDDDTPRDSFRSLVTEAREFQYERIDDETARVARALQELAAPPPTSPLASDRYSLSVLRATLLHCLSSPGSLLIVSSARAIGVQLPSALRSSVLCELGAYRVLTAQCMRQEWVALSRHHVHCFRSFSLRAAKRVPLLQVLAVRAVDDLDVLCGGDERERWFGIEIHLVLEVVTLLVATSAARDAFVRELAQRLDELASDPARRSMFVAPALSLDDQSLSVCLNQRTVWRRRRGPRASRVLDDGADAPETAAELVKASLEAAMALFAVDDRQTWTPRAVLALLDAVERLNTVDLAAGTTHSHSQRLAFALHLYHTLLLHAALVFGGFPRSHAQWRKMQVVPSYLVGDPRLPDAQVRFTLRDIERELLRSPMPPASIMLEGGASSLLRLHSPFSRPAATAGSGAGAARLPSLGVTSPTARRVLAQTQSRIPEHLALERPDFRACFLLQMNCDPAVTRVVRVYERADADGGADRGAAASASPKSKAESLDAQFDRTCARFLATELRVDAAARAIHVPRVCDWYFRALDEQRLESAGSCSSSSSSSNAGLAASGSRAFFCLQRLLPFMDDAARQRVQHLLMGAGDACAISFGEFWTRQSAAAMLSDAFARTPSSSEGLGEVGGRAEAIALANSSGLERFLRSLF